MDQTGSGRVTRFDSSKNTIDDPATNDIIGTKCWVEVVGEKNKERIYGTRQLAGGIAA